MSRASRPQMVSTSIPAAERLRTCPQMIVGGAALVAPRPHPASPIPSTPARANRRTGPAERVQITMAKNLRRHRGPIRLGTSDRIGLVLTRARADVAPEESSEGRSERTAARSAVAAAGAGLGPSGGPRLGGVWQAKTVRQLGAGSTVWQTAMEAGRLRVNVVPAGHRASLAPARAGRESAVSVADTPWWVRAKWADGGGSSERAHPMIRPPCRTRERIDRRLATRLGRSPGAVSAMICNPLQRHHWLPGSAPDSRIGPITDGAGGCQLARKRPPAGATRASPALCSIPASQCRLAGCGSTLTGHHFGLRRDTRCLAQSAGSTF